MIIGDIYLKSLDRGDAVRIPSEYLQNSDTFLYKIDNGKDFQCATILIPVGYLENEGQEKRKGEELSQTDFILNDDMITGFNVEVVGEQGESQGNVDVSCFKQEQATYGENGEYVGGLTNSYLAKMQNDDGDVLLIFEAGGGFEKSASLFNSITSVDRSFQQI